MAAGNFEQAIPLFRQSSAAAPFVYTAANNLAICLFATGRLDEAIRTQTESLQAAPFPNPFGLANRVTFYTVNGEEEAAQRDLRRIPLGYYKAERARRYLDLLRENAPPHTVRGDWPYLFSYEICPFDAIQKGVRHDAASWLSRRIVVDFCEAVLNESAADPESGIELLARATHPEAVLCFG